MPHAWNTSVLNLRLTLDNRTPWWNSRDAIPLPANRCKQLKPNLLLLMQIPCCNYLLKITSQKNISRGRNITLVTYYNVKLYKSCFNRLIRQFYTSRQHIFGLCQNEWSILSSYSAFPIQPMAIWASVGECDLTGRSGSCVVGYSCGWLN